MKKNLCRAFIVSLIFSLGLSVNAFAKVGDMGFFGGISEGRKLPKTTEEILKEDKKKNDKATFNYKELVLLGGEPVEVPGILTVDSKESKIKESDTEGTYKINFKVAYEEGSPVSVSRDITFDVNFRKELTQGQENIQTGQVIYDYEVASWAETIVCQSGEYSIVPDKSHFNISILMDKTPGVDYYKGTISMVAVYTQGEGNNITVQSTGSIYGYDSAWSSTETHRIDTWVYGDGWQTQYQLRPSVSVNKTLQYSQNEPTAISFSGNYMEVISNTSSLSYDLLVKPNWMYAVEDKGAINIPSYNTFEQLIAPNTNFLKGHFAEADINKLFSMKILEGDPHYFKPEQAMTRGQFVEALAKAAKMPKVTVEKKTKKQDKTTVIVFPDVTEDRPEYGWIMAAYYSGLAMGRDNGNFYTDSPITREEAIVILVRTLGLENLGLDPTPIAPFTDDAKISSWAKKEIYAAQRLGIIAGDSDGNIRPLENISKAEGAALVNRLINYMRHDLVTDYTEHIVNYVY